MLGRMSIGVIPLRDIFYNRYLTAPNKLFDYLSRAIPVVAADLPSIRDFISEDTGALFFQPGYVGQLRDALAVLLKDNEKYKSLAAASNKHRANYDWRVRGLQMIEEMRQAAAV